MNESKNNKRLKTQEEKVKKNNKSSRSRPVWLKKKRNFQSQMRNDDPTAWCNLD